jgi:K+-sensing histidine kinase KdpD
MNKRANMMKSGGITDEKVYERVEKVFLSYVSHRVRTPLNSIIGFSKLLLNSEMDPSRKKEFVEMIMDSGYEILRYFENILDASEMDTGMFAPNFKKVDLEQIMTGVSGEYADRSFSGKLLNIRFSSLINDKNTIVITDEFILKRIIQNLIEVLIKNLEKGEIDVFYSITKEHIIIKAEGHAANKLLDENIIIDDELSNNDKDSLEYLSMQVVKRMVNILKGKVSLEKTNKNSIVLGVDLPNHSNC